MQTTGKHTNSSYSPSFNSYFNTGLAVIAARVTTEFPDDDEFAVTDLKSSANGAVELETVCEDDLDSDDFEFDLSNLTPEDGEIRPVYPVFNRDLLRPSDPEEEDFSKITIQLQSLFLEDRHRSGADLDPPSSSSSEADEMEEVPPGTYCVWAPKKSPVASPSPGRCTKSNSTGSSASLSGKAKSWKLTDFLKRSKSDGKEGLMLLTSKKVGAPAVRTINGPRRSVTAYYGGGETKRRSYLPYRQDLVGLFATPHAFRKMNLPPF